jgi:hypothetical protein
MNYVPSYSTYAFEDLVTTISHPSLGKIDIQGSGVGSITFAMSNDSSAHDVAADGSVMTSKIQARNGTVAIEVQETAPFHKWMIKAYNYLMAGSSREWALFGLYGRSPDMQVVHEGRYMSIQKEADKPYQQQGGRVTWTFLAANLTERIE